MGTDRDNRHGSQAAMVACKSFRGFGADFTYRANALDEEVPGPIAIAPSMQRSDRCNAVNGVFKFFMLYL